MDEQLNGWGEILNDDDDETNTIFEYWNDNSKKDSSSQTENYMESGYSCDITDNFTPTKYFYEDTDKMSSYFKDYLAYYKMNGTKYGGIDGSGIGDYIKSDFTYRFKDHNSKEWTKIRLPLIYRPFYANVMFYIDIVSATNLDEEETSIFTIGDCKVKYAIFNGITQKIGDKKYSLGELKISIGDVEKTGSKNELRMYREYPDTFNYKGDADSNNVANNVRFYTIGKRENGTNVLYNVITTSGSTFNNKHNTIAWQVINSGNTTINGNDIDFSFYAVDNLSKDSNALITEISENDTINLKDITTGRIYKSTEGIINEFITDSDLGTTPESNKLSSDDCHEEHVNGKWFGSVCLKYSGITVDKEVTSDYVYRVIDDAALYDGEDKIYDSGTDGINGDTNAYKYFPYQTTFVTYVIRYPKDVYNTLLNQYKDNTSNDAATTALDETV